MKIYYLLNEENRVKALCHDPYIGRDEYIESDIFPGNIDTLEYTVEDGQLVHLGGLTESEIARRKEIDQINETEERIAVLKKWFDYDNYGTWEQMLRRRIADEINDIVREKIYTSIDQLYQEAEAVAAELKLLSRAVMKP